MKQAGSRAEPANKILVVEDETVIALDIEAQLQGLGYRVTGISRSGDDALRKVAEDTPDLVLMDIRISGEVDGIDTARQIVEKHDIAVVFLTAHADKETVERARQVGPFGYLMKPFQDRGLATALEIALDRHRAARELRHQGEWLSGVLANMADGVIVTDQTGHVLFMNPVAESLTGWQVSEALYLPATTVLPLRDIASGANVDDLVSTSLQYMRPVAIPQGLYAISKARWHFPVEGEVAPLPDEASLKGCVITFRNISARLQDLEEGVDVLLVPRPAGPAFLQ